MAAGKLKIMGLEYGKKAIGNLRKKLFSKNHNYLDKSLIIGFNSILIKVSKIAEDKKILCYFFGKFN